MSTQAPAELAVFDPLQVKYQGNKGRILEMLGNGMGPEITATACGVTPSYVSQLLSDKEFTEAVTARRFHALQAHTARDAKADALEDALLDKMKDLLPLMYKPHEVLRAYAVINAAKRRGAGASQEANTIINNQVVNLVLPPAVVQRFTRDTNNQVIEVESKEVMEMPQPKQNKQSLVTMPSSHLKEMLAARSGTQQLENTNVYQDPTAPPNGSGG